MNLSTFSDDTKMDDFYLFGAKTEGIMATLQNGHVVIAHREKKGIVGYVFTSSAAASTYADDHDWPDDSYALITHQFSRH